MIVLNAWNEMIWSFTFYFSFGLVVLLSIPVAIVRPIQVLYKGKLRGFFSLVELLVELLRLLQYGVILTYGMGFPLREVFGSTFWRQVLSRLEQLQWAHVLYQFVGFAIVFAVINILLFLIILRKSTVAVVMEKCKNKTKSFTHFDVSTVRTAAMLAVKNVFVIPVSVIYMFHILGLL